MSVRRTLELRDASSRESFTLLQIAEEARYLSECESKQADTLLLLSEILAQLSYRPVLEDLPLHPYVVVSSESRLDESTCEDGSRDSEAPNQDDGESVRVKGSRKDEEKGRDSR